MIERNYSKDSTSIRQELTIFIQADKETVFHLLATTEGITKWFPQLSIEDEQVLFDLGDGSFEKMRLLDYQTNDHISYEWATGQIHFQLESSEEGTQLTLQETLPIHFKAFPEDFTGWYVQMKSIKNTAEKGAPLKFNKAEIKEIKKSIIEQLN